LLFTCRSFTLSRKTTFGGAKDLLSGRTLRKDVRCFAGIISRICQPIWVFTTLGCLKRARLKLSLHVNTGFRDFAIFITGFTAAGSSNGHFKKFSSPAGQNFRFVFAGQMSHGAVVGSVRGKTF
jgi:hypothetical protein